MGDGRRSMPDLNEQGIEAAARAMEPRCFEVLDRGQPPSSSWLEYRAFENAISNKASRQESPRRNHGVSQGNGEEAVSIRDSHDDKMKNRKYRAAWAGDNTVLWLALQIRRLREDRGLSQAQFGELIGTSASAISRLENPDYGKWSVRTLLAIADALDIALEIKFIGWPELKEHYRDLSPDAMRVQGYEVVTEKKQ